MRVEPGEPCPLPDDPVLAEFAKALADAGHWAQVVDAEWRIVYMTDDMRQSVAGSGRPLAPLVIGAHLSGPEIVAVVQEWAFNSTQEELLLWLGPTMLADLSGDRERLKAQVDPSLRHLVDQLTPAPSDVEVWSHDGSSRGVGAPTADIQQTCMRIRDSTGTVRGNVMISKPAAGMHAISALAVQQDLEHLQRMQQVISADRRPMAILFADLEASSALARRLPTATYFALTRNLVRATDNAVIQAGGLVGRHVGDGVVAFFPAVTFDSESAAARACIQVARSIRAATDTVAERSNLEPTDVVMRFGLHWGSSPYLGGITTGARTEVTALGDEVNETARIEACATGGRILATKQLIERLSPADAAAVDVQSERLAYTRLGDLDSATDKARRDAPMIAVCQL
jgi:class 3 adenylate cyclase